MLAVVLEELDKEEADVARGVDLARLDLGVQLRDGRREQAGAKGSRRAAHLKEGDDEADDRVAPESAGEDFVHAPLVEERFDEHDEASRDAVVDELGRLDLHFVHLGLSLALGLLRHAGLDPVGVPRRVLLEQVPHAHRGVHAALLVHAQVDREAAITRDKLDDRHSGFRDHKQRRRVRERRREENRRERV